MSLKVLRNQEANSKGMMQLVKYNVAEAGADNYDRHIWSYTTSDGGDDTGKEPGTGN